MASRQDVKDFVFHLGSHSFSWYGISALLCWKSQLSPPARNRATREPDASLSVLPEMAEEEDKQKLNKCDIREYKVFLTLN